VKHSSQLTKRSKDNINTFQQHFSKISILAAFQPNWSLIKTPNQVYYSVERYRRTEDLDQDFVLGTGFGKKVFNKDTEFVGKNLQL
jgi:hypothetical protein